MTQHSSDMVERVARAIYLANGERSFGDECDEASARAALEASHHAELVEALQFLRRNPHLPEAQAKADALLAKIGGDA